MMSSYYKVILLSKISCHFESTDIHSQLAGPTHECLNKGSHYSGRQIICFESETNSETKIDRDRYKNKQEFQILSNLT